MNRITGIFSFDNAPVHPDEINRMIGALKSDARDEQSIWLEEGVGLACTHIGHPIGEQNGRLLSRVPNHQFVITFDGRIDNRRELLANLKHGWLADYARISDEEIVLAAYEKWELRCPEHLIGDFAFAIWDKKERRLLCVRDHFGVKPFYYSLFKKSFLFASTPHALLASRRVPAVIQEERIADFLVNPLEGVDKSSSFYMGVFRLPPAHMLIIQKGGMTLRRYWELCPAVRSELKTEADHIESFQEFFTEAVYCRLQDASRPASMLSGGIDSSSIVGMARQVLAREGKSLRTFAVISNSTSTNRESLHIRSVLDQGNLQPHLISETELSQRIDQLLQAIEGETEPFDCLMNLNRAVYLHAHDCEVSTLLDGIDGDMLLSGSGHLVQLWQQGAFQIILEETLNADGLTAEYKMGKTLFYNSLFSAFLPFAPDWLRTLRRPARYGKALRSAIRETIIDQDFAVRSHLGERFAMLDSHRPRPLSFTQLEFHKITLDHPFLTVGLERYERVASTFGIEARHPFTDVRLAEFCLGLPWYLKTRRGWTKMILRRAMEPYLRPDVIWRRDKDSLMWEVNRLILKARSDYFYQITLDEQASLKPYVDLQKLMKFWQEYLTQGDEKHAELIWSGIALAMWLRRHRNMVANLR